MKAKFTWRKNAECYTLLGWSDVLTKAELPSEYVGGPGPKFWDSRRNVTLGPDSTVPDKLFESMVLTDKQYTIVMDYLCAAGKRLSRIMKEIEEGEEFTVQV